MTYLRKTIISVQNIISKQDVYMPIHRKHNMTITNWIFAKICYFILFISNFPAYVVDNWMCGDIVDDRNVDMLIKSIGLH